MAAFNRSLRLILDYEGGYSDDPDDVGGITYKGVAKNYYPDWEGWYLIDSYKNDRNFPQVLDSVDDLDDMVADFYKQHYWNRFWGDQISSQVIAEELFDTSVNMGVSRGVRFLQTALNVLNRNQSLYEDLVEDGVFGNKTFSALNKYLENDKADLLCKIQNVLQGQHYIDYMKRSPTQEKFARGWFKRVKIDKFSNGC